MNQSQTTDQQSLSGFLLSRHWRDTDDGLELSFWASSERGPLRLVFTGQQAVCFCQRDFAADLAGLSQRKPLQLRTLQGQAVDGLYFDSYRALKHNRERLQHCQESDVNPQDRFLMERFVRACFSAQGPLIRHRRYLEMHNGRLASADYQPQLSCASLDIETDGFSDTLYSIAVAHQQESVVFMLGKRHDSQHTDYSVRYFADEAALLRAFLLWFRELDPDLIIGWNVVGFDLLFLQQKCRQLDIPFSLGRADEQAFVMPRDKTRSGLQAPARARVPGRAVLDGIELLRAGFWSFESFALDNVAHEMLGEGKSITLSGQQKIQEINRQFREDKEGLAAYNFRDCVLVQRIFEHADLVNFAIKRAQMTGLDIDRMGGSVASFDNLYLPRLHRQGFVAPNVDNERSGGLGSPGGYVMDSSPGLYSNVLVLDFKSLYPSIIRTFLIDPLGLNSASLAAEASSEDTVEGFLGARFSREQAILPDLIGELWEQRDRAKSRQDAALSQAIKIIMNSFYGVLGTPVCRFYDPRLASSITLRGHQIITDSRQQIEQQGYQVIYGDTDSVFVLLDKEASEQQARQAGEQLAELLNNYWQQKLSREFNLPCYLEIEFETHYLKFLMPTIRGESTGSKKRYAGLLKAADGSLQVQFKGLEAARTDWSPLARDFQRELYWRVFTGRDYLELVSAVTEDLLAGKLDDKLSYRKRLRRPVEEYTKNVPPHVQAARKLDKPGRFIEYIITLNGPEPLENLQSAPDYQHYLDRQLAPAADGILQFMNCSFAELTSAQMSMF